MNFTLLLQDFKLEYKKEIAVLSKEYPNPTDLDNFLLNALQESYTEIYFILSIQIEEPLSVISRELLEKYTKMLTLAVIYLKAGHVSQANEIRREVLNSVYDIRKAAGSKNSFIFKIKDLM